MGNNQKDLYGFDFEKIKNHARQKIDTIQERIQYLKMAKLEYGEEKIKHRPKDNGFLDIYWHNEVTLSTFMLSINAEIKYWEERIQNDCKTNTLTSNIEPIEWKKQKNMLSFFLATLMDEGYLNMNEGGIKNWKQFENHFSYNGKLITRDELKSMYGNYQQQKDSVPRGGKKLKSKLLKNH